MGASEAFYIPYKPVYAIMVALSKNDNPAAMETIVAYVTPL